MPRFVARKHCLNTCHPWIGLCLTSLGTQSHHLCPGNVTVTVTVTRPSSSRPEEEQRMITFYSRFSAFSSPCFSQSPRTAAQIRHLHPDRIDAIAASASSTYCTSVVLAGENDLCCGALDDLAVVRCCCSRSPPATIGFLTYGSKQTRPPGHAPCLSIEYALNIGIHHQEPPMLLEGNIPGQRDSLFARYSLVNLA